MISAASINDNVRGEVQEGVQQQENKHPVLLPLSSLGPSRGSYPLRGSVSQPRIMGGWCDESFPADTSSLGALDRVGCGEGRPLDIER